MNRNYILCAAGGAVVGFGFGALVFRKHYRDYYVAQAEDNRAYYNKKLSDLSAVNRNKPDPEELVRQVTQKEEEQAPFAGIPGSSAEDDIPEDAVISVQGPVLTEIGQDDYVTMTGYDKAEVVVYRDGVLATVADDDVLDIDETVGIDAVQRVARGLDEVVWIRNESNHMEYEVTYDEHTYTEATGIILKG